MYVYDTSVIISNPSSVIEDFPGSDIVIPMTVIRELEELKKLQGTRARQARRALRHIREIIGSSNEDGNTSLSLASSGIPRIYRDGKDYGGNFLVELNHSGVSETDPIHDKFSIQTEDDRIIIVARNLSKEGHDVILVTKDTGMAIIASSVDVKVEFYTQDNEFDPGSGIANYTPEYDEISRLHNGEMIEIEKDKELYPMNTGVIVSSPGAGSALGVSDGRFIYPISSDPYIVGSKLTPRGAEQKIAMNLLTGEHMNSYVGNHNPNEFFGSLSGRAGSGKTALALAAGINSLLTSGGHDYIKIFRPTVAPSKNSDLGHLPGSLEEKMQPWYLAIEDVISNLDISETNLETSDGSMVSVMEKISHETVNHVRGRGFHNTFIIIDEAQNFEPHELTTLLTRAGSGSAVVMTWDQTQVDNPYVTTGRAEGPLSVLQKVMPHPMVWHIELKNSERGGVSAIFN